MEGHRQIRTFFFLFTAAFLLWIFPKTASAATFYLSPSSGQQGLGSSFTVTVYLSNADKVMNALSGTISFPTDTLEVASVSKNASIINLWVLEPTYSNGAGRVSFEGIVLNPGYTGLRGKVISIVFKTKTAGVAKLAFTSAAVLANDGKGTNILTVMGTASFTIGTGAPSAPEPTEPAAPAAPSVPRVPKIASSSHPDSSLWYSANDAVFSWNLPKDITEVRLSIARSEAIPTISYVPPISAKAIADLDDGVWYFNVRMKNAVGWSQDARYRIQIDSSPPVQFKIQEASDPDVTGRIFELTAEDRESGIDHYEASLDGGPYEIWADGQRSFDGLSQGKHVIAAHAFDKAGNIAEISFVFVEGEGAVIAAPAAAGPSAWARLLAWMDKHVKGSSLLWPFLAMVWFLVTFFGWRKAFLYRRLALKNSSDADRSVKNAFGRLRESLRERFLELALRSGGAKNLMGESLFKNLRRDIDRAERESMGERRAVLTIPDRARYMRSTPAVSSIKTTPAAAPPSAQAKTQAPTPVKALTRTSQRKRSDPFRR